tara:strand:- start:165 stop:566 length:402 start_codon:yes stop_codon:yes gene_type:complete
MQINNEIIKELEKQEKINENSFLLSEDLEELLYSDSDIEVDKTNNPYVYFQTKSEVFKTKLVNYQKKGRKEILHVLSNISCFNLLDRNLIDKVHIEFDEDNFKEILCSSKKINYKIKLCESNIYLLKIKIKDA